MMPCSLDEHFISDAMLFCPSGPSSQHARPHYAQCSCQVPSLIKKKVCFVSPAQGHHHGVLDHLAQWVIDEANEKLSSEAAALYADALSWPREVGGWAGSFGGVGS